MRILPKLLTLVLTVALVPLVGLSFYQLRTVLTLNREVAEYAGSLMVEEAVRELRQLVSAYSRIEHQDDLIVGATVLLQAREAEGLLADVPPEDTPVYYAEDFDAGLHLPPDAAPSEKYAPCNLDGHCSQKTISLEEPDFKLAPGTTRDAVMQDIRRLTGMKRIYKKIYSEASESILFNITAMESGVVSQYPGMGGYPEEYDPRTRPWYIEAKEKGDLIWTSPMLDAQGLGLASFAAVPLYYPDGTFAGVTAIEECIFEGLKVAEYDSPWASSMEAFLVSLEARPETGKPGLQIIGKREHAKESGDWRILPQMGWLNVPFQEQLDTMTRRIRAYQTGVENMPFNGRESLWAYGAAGGEEAALVIIIPIEEITARARRMQEQIREKAFQKLSVIIGASLVFILATIWASFAASRAVTRPLRALSRAAEEISTGGLSADVPHIDSADEVGDLTRAIARMKDDLKVYIRDLTEAVTSRERIDSELKIARRIQMSFLPKAASCFPERSGLDLSAMIEPAREIGGDLYDFFFINETDLFFSVGDVSGKGVPAALFMAVTKSLMKSVAREDVRPHEILRLVNAELRRDNDSMMFVTLLCGILNTATGEMLLGNAGHNPPILLRRHGEASFLKLEKALVLGVSELAVYRSQALRLEPGDGLFLYTDGVTEAADESGDLFTRRRLLEIVSGMGSASSEQLVQGVMEHVRSFSGKAPQSDDITMLMIRIKGREG